MQAGDSVSPPQRQYQMETVGDGIQAAKQLPEQAAMRPSGSGQPARPGQSGEGARSALELLIQMETKRNAQRPREGSGPANAPDSAP
jgi:hypothetical protein